MFRDVPVDRPKAAPGMTICESFDSIDQYLPVNIQCIIHNAMQIYHICPRKPMSWGGGEGIWYRRSGGRWNSSLPDGRRYPPLSENSRRCRPLPRGRRRRSLTSSSRITITISVTFTTKNDPSFSFKDEASKTAIFTPSKESIGIDDIQPFQHRLGIRAMGRW
ncbi:hypothetical protein PQX77_019138 [Marasmius sp. AFHP31]|nr:hypothetical protein PQX77_019138 [Marasmius sp. AFHP31]